MSTPDFTPEALAALAVTIAGNLIIIFGLEMTADRQAALFALINNSFVVAFLVHSAWIRGKRAENAAEVLRAKSGEQPASIEMDG
jgi:hypothetical protein